MIFKCVKKFFFFGMLIVCYSMNYAEDPLDHFNWKNSSISYQRDWMRYVQKVLEISLKSEKVKRLFLLCVIQKKRIVTITCNGNQRYM